MSNANVMVLKANLVTEEREPEESDGRAKTKGEARMKNHLYEDENGIIHICEGGHATPDQQNYLVWTKCSIDVPPNKSFKSDELPTCQKCLKSI